MMCKRERLRLMFWAATAVGLVSAGACLTEKHVVGDGPPDAQGDAAVGATDSMVPTDGAVATDGADASQPGSPDASPDAVVGLGEKPSVGWALAIPPEEVARRLSQLMLQRPATAALTAAVVASAPTTNQDVGALANGLLLDEGSAAGRQAFYRWWLSLDNFESRLPQMPLSAPLTSSGSAKLVDQALAFAEDVTWQPASNLTLLLTQPMAFISADTTPWFAGVTAPAGTGTAKVKLNATLYSGILTQPAVAAANDYASRPAPSRRGLSLRARLLCQMVPAEPALTPEVPLPAGASIRDSIEKMVASSSCQPCHGFVDSLGFAFGHFDQLGAFHDTDGDAPVDTSGSFSDWPSTGESVPFSGAPELARVLAARPEAKSCHAAQWLTFAIGTFRNGLVPAAAGSSRAPTYGPDPSASPPWGTPLWSSPTADFTADVDYIVQRATVQGELNLRDTLRAVTETHLFLAP